MKFGKLQGFHARLLRQAGRKATVLPDSVVSLPVRLIFAGFAAVERMSFSASGLS